MQPKSAFTARLRDPAAAPDPSYDMLATRRRAWCGRPRRMSMVGVRRASTNRGVDMQIKAPAVPTNHRAQVLSALVALVVAGGAYGAISVGTDDDVSSQSSKPVVTNVAHGRIL